MGWEKGTGTGKGRIIAPQAGSPLLAGMAALKAGRFERAATLHDHAAEADPNNAQAKRFRAQALEGTWDWTAATAPGRSLSRGMAMWGS